MNLCEQIATRRNRGRTVCRIFRGAQVLPRKESLKRIGYKDIPHDLWVTMSRSQAQSLLTDCLAHDLAHGEPIMDESEAKRLAASFVDVFPQETTFITNTARFSDGTTSTDSSGWEPISHATFDTGVIAEAGGVIGILWVEDED